MPQRCGHALRRIGLACFAAVALPAAAQGYGTPEPGTDASLGPAASRPAGSGSNTSASSAANGPTNGSDELPRRGDPQRTAERRAPVSMPTSQNAAARRAAEWARLPPAPGEFERYVQRLVAPAEIRRFGAELMTAPADAGLLPEGIEGEPQVPADYLVQPGDELTLTLWGSVDTELRLQVDRAGRIGIPRVGSVQVAGVRHADLADVLRRRIAQVFRNFDLSIALVQLRSVRIYVTGFVARPGSYTVGGLTTLINAVMRSGGPAASGSFRNIQLRRGNGPVSTLDLYDFLLKGERSADRLVQANDVIHVGPVGPEVALIGSVNRPAVFELAPGETVADLLRMAGGFNAVADRQRLAVERLNERNDRRIVQLMMPGDAAATLASGDVLRVFSAIDTALPAERQNKRVRIEGEVQRPGDYVLPPQTTIADALAAAGGLTPSAYLFGTEFSRDSVRVSQQENYDRALRDIETEFTRATSTQRTASAEDASVQNAREIATNRLIDRLRSVRPTGRIVLQLTPDARSLPPLVLEDGDRLLIPRRGTTVGVFGSVVNGGSYLYESGQHVDDYLRLAGGPTRGADAASAFVIRANGSVVSSRQGGGWPGGRGALASAPAEPGDTLFVPEEIDKTTFIQSAKDWTQILYQFGLGAAAIATFR